MPDWIDLQNKAFWGSFIFGFLSIGLWETYRPFRTLTVSNLRRWTIHLLLATCANIIVIVAPMSAVAVALLADSNPYGVLRPLPLWASFPLTILLLDLMRWAEHWAYHRIELLWRLHQVHHADPDYDLTTALRFHPFEALAGHVSTLACVWLLAPPLSAVVVSSAMIVVQNFFTHANANLPERIDLALRRIFVTPNLHRIHHSMHVEDQNTNFANVFSFWDRWFGTYRDRASDGLQPQRVGLDNVTPERALDLLDALAMPFRSLQPSSTAAPAEPAQPSQAR
jgi:sterol desaturase/sphingolipid hydroxylase (fatty acid hydroxylase superfamily)